MNSTKKAREILKLLECPYIIGLDDAVIHELLLSSGEARQRLLKWLIGRTRPVIQNSVSALLPLKSDIGITARLTELLSILGVCLPNDYDLVKGSSSIMKQAMFWEALTEVVYCSCVNSNVHDLMFESRLNDQSNTSCLFLESLLVGEDISSVFHSEITLIPAEISHAASIDNNLFQKNKVPSVCNLKRRVDEIEDSTEKLQLQLSRLMEQTYMPLDVNAINSCTTGIQLCLETLLQLMDDFVRSYYDEFKPWTNKDPSILSCLGPLSERVNCSLMIVNELLESCLKLQEICIQWMINVRTKSILPKDTYKDHVHVFENLK